MTILALAVAKKMLVFICDVKGAFLYADLYEDVREVTRVIL
jgi:hypothetical protein